MNLMTLLPPDYETNATMIKLQEILSEESNDIEAALEKVINERFIDTAVDTLARREQMFDIKNKYGDSPSDLAIRRKIIKAKLRGRGTLTKKAFVEYIKTFLGDGIDVEIVERSAEYAIDIIISQWESMSLDYLNSMRDAILEVIPAHLGPNYILQWIYEFLNKVLFEASDIIVMTDWQPRQTRLFFDGTWSFDGTYTFNGVKTDDVELCPVSNIAIVADTVIKIGSSASVFKEQYFDGSWNFDGSTLFDAGVTEI